MKAEALSFFLNIVFHSDSYSINILLTTLVFIYVQLFTQKSFPLLHKYSLKIEFTSKILIQSIADQMAGGDWKEFVYEYVPSITLPCNTDSKGEFKRPSRKIFLQPEDSWKMCENILYLLMKIKQLLKISKSLAMEMSAREKSSARPEIKQRLIKSEKRHREQNAKTRKEE